MRTLLRLTALGAALCLAAACGQSPTAPVASRRHVLWVHPTPVLGNTAADSLR
jgi:hypothetical protein